MQTPDQLPDSGRAPAADNAPAATRVGRAGRTVTLWVGYRGRLVGRRFRRTTAHQRALVGAAAVVVLVPMVAFVVTEPVSSGFPVLPPAAHATGRAGLTGNAQLESLGKPPGTTTPLPPATTPPAPAPPSVANAAPLGSHEVFGFAPYWTLAQSTGFDLAGLTTIAYFSIGVNPDGSLAESGPGWNGYQSQALANLVTAAHAAGDRVVLTVNDFDQQSLDQLTSSPSAPGTLATALTSAIEAKNLDGVNLDLEGDGSADQAGLTNLVTTVSSTLHQVNPHWQVTMDTYASSAADPGGFYNIPALATAVDGFFVMQYSPNMSATQQASSPLTSGLFSDQTAAQEYAAAAPGAKVILGAPFYGDDWPTTGNTLNATATGPASQLADSQITAGHPTYWDSVTDTAWTAYQVGNQWHEAFFDDPSTLFQVAQIAEQNHLGGVGIWALGMDGNNPAMVAALDGNAPVVKYASPGTPNAATTTTPTTTGPVTAAAPTTAPAATASGPVAPSTPTTATPAKGAGTTTTTTTKPPVTTTTAPTTTTTTTAPPSTTGGGPTTPPVYTYTGTWGGQTVALTPGPAVATSVLTEPGAQQLGTLASFTTTDPGSRCLATAPDLAVWQLPPPATPPASGSSTPATAGSAAKTVYTVVAVQPGDCVTASFTFTPPPPVPPVSTSTGSIAPVSPTAGTGGSGGGAVADLKEPTPAS